MNFRIVYKQQLPNGKKKLREAAVDAENMEEAICIVKQYLKEENITAQLGLLWGLLSKFDRRKCGRRKLLEESKASQ